MKKIYLTFLTLLIAGSICYAQKKTSGVPKKPQKLTIKKPPVKVQEAPPPLDNVQDSQMQMPVAKDQPRVVDVAPVKNNAAGFNQYSNNKIATKDDILVNKLTLKVDESAKVTQDALLIYGSNGIVVSFDTEQKKVNWTYAEQGIKSSNDNKFSVDHTTVYIPYFDGTITALNVNTGAVNWKDKIGLVPESNLLVKQNAMVSNGLVYVASRNSNMYAVNKITGAMVWNYLLDYKYNIYPPVAANNSVFINNAPFVFKFDAANGRGIWRRGFKKAMYAKMLADEKYLYAADESSTLFAVDLDGAAGEIAWEFNLEDNQYGIGENVILDNGIIYLAGKGNPGSKASSIYAVKAADGKLLWRADLPRKEIMTMSLIDQKIYGYMEDNFFTIDAKDGKVLLSAKPQEIPMSNIIDESPKTLLYVSSNGLVRYDKSGKGTEVLEIPQLKTETKEDRTTLQFVKKDQ